MIKLCGNCKQEMLRCELCLLAGAFDEDGETRQVHSVNCRYEICKICVERHRQQFKIAMIKASRGE